MTGQRGPTPAPYFSIADGAWIPYSLTRDPETGEFRGVEGAARVRTRTARRWKRAGSWW
jgi:hypothetical protein